MTAAKEIIAALIAGGMDAPEAAELLTRAAVEMTAKGPSKSALRTRAWRERRASQSVTCDAAKSGNLPVDDSVSERHKPSQSVTGDKVPLSLRNNNQESNQERDAGKRGTRLSDAWAPTAHDLQTAVALFGEADAHAILAKFRDYWKAQPGARAMKLDWDATFRNWCRNEVQYSKRGQTNAKRSTAAPTGHDAILAAASRKARELVGDGEVAGATDQASPAEGLEVDRNTAGRGKSTAGGLQGDS